MNKINLGEAAAVELHKSNESHGMKELKNDMQQAGKVLNKTKKELEYELNRAIVTSENYINLTDNKNLIENK